MNKFPLDGNYSYITGVEETKSPTEDACLTEDCVEGDNVNFGRHYMLPKILDEIAFRDEILSKNSDIPLLSKKMEILNKWIGADFEPYRQRQSGPFQGSFLFLSWILIFFLK